ncbi:MAG: hypothetical protein KJO21_09315 [Verrucomicrobiae bacterium]|nr:hypothetical protein [Verrucomicrobiae bacterium]NNJ43677.1 hypothetical protein [Akkermansiaceae bacterium]
MSAQTDKIKESSREFLATNAVFFAQMCEPLNALFQSSGPMQILSDESEMTLVVAVRATEETDEAGAMDVDCVMLEPNHESLRTCVNSIL